MKQENTVSLPLEVNVDLERMNQLKEDTIICDMCGHANPRDAAMCEQCSNYLNEIFYSKTLRR